MTALVYCVIGLLIVTKLMDVVSTLQRVKHAQAETNPIARNMMVRIGTQKAVWLVFIVALVIIGITGATALKSGLLTQSLFIIVGVAISVVQAAVALTNWTSRYNFVTRRVRTLHSIILKQA